jgi:hypothetical protein
MSDDLKVLEDFFREGEATVEAIHHAFGAPGDFGYDSPEGKALYGLYMFWGKIHDAMSIHRQMAAVEAAMQPVEEGK